MNQDIISELERIHEVVRTTFDLSSPYVGSALSGMSHTIDNLRNEGHRLELEKAKTPKTPQDASEIPEATEVSPASSDARQTPLHDPANTFTIGSNPREDL